MQPLSRIYLSSFIFTIPLALTAYIGSTFLAFHVEENLIGFIYTIGALVTLTLLEVLPFIVAKYGNRNTTVGLLIVNTLMLLILARSSAPETITAAFILYQVTTTLIWYCLDIFIEHFSKNKEVGTIRGAYLSLTNFAWMITPLLGGYLIGRSGFGLLFTIAFICTTTATIVLGILFSEYRDVPYRTRSSFAAIKSLSQRLDLFRVIAFNFILQFFYAWMVIYTPLYLYENFGLSFKTVGAIFTVMLSAFVIVQYPLGRFSDRIGEKKLLGFGLLILGGATLLFAFTKSSTPLILGLILFLTRIGAATVEVMSETYFFKNVTDADVEIISLFRVVRPLAYVVAPLLGTLILINSTYETLFIILGCGILASLTLLTKLHEKR
jgi:MFS family permease